MNTTSSFRVHRRGPLLVSLLKFPFKLAQCCLIQSTVKGRVLLERRGWMRTGRWGGWASSLGWGAGVPSSCRGPVWVLIGRNQHNPATNSLHSLWGSAGRDGDCKAGGAGIREVLSIKINRRMALFNMFEVIHPWLKTQWFIWLKWAFC